MFDLLARAQVIQLLKSIETGDATPVGYINPNKYIQHNLMVKDGLAGFGEVLQQLPKGSAKVNTVRALQDENYVVTHTEYNFFGPKIGFDVFRFTHRVIVKHWYSCCHKFFTLLRTPLNTYLFNCIIIFGFHNRHN